MIPLRKDRESENMFPETGDISEIEVEDRASCFAPLKLVLP
jgi:hypothetical protein